MNKMTIAGIFSLLVFILSFNSEALSAEIHDLAKQGNMKKLKHQLKIHPDQVNLKDEYGSAPLHYSAYFGRADVTELLISKGADINIKDRDSRTPLFQVSTIGRIKPPVKNLMEVALLLVKNGADVNATDIHGWTPLFEASFYGQKEIAEILIKNGARVNAKSKQGKTPIFFAEKNQHKETADLLRKNGAK